MSSVGIYLSRCRIHWQGYRLNCAYSMDMHILLASGHRPCCNIDLRYSDRVYTGLSIRPCGKFGSPMLSQMDIHKFLTDSCRLHQPSLFGSIGPRKPFVKDHMALLLELKRDSHDIISLLLSTICNMQDKKRWLE